MWFIINPHYGMKNYNSKNVWWHSWWYGQPSGNWISAIIMTISTLGSYYLENDTTLIWSNFITFSYLILAVMLNLFLASPDKLNNSPCNKKKLVKQK